MATDVDERTESATIAGGVPGRLLVEGELAWLYLDDPAKKVNTLSSRLFAWFAEQLDQVERERPAALVIVSGKRDGFVAGADIEELQGATDPLEVVALLKRGHALMERLAHLPFPTVAAIHGACLGGGLELALACRHRVATEHPKTKLGLPEVQLGLIPGLGGTQRLPRLVGVQAALDLILTGKQLDAKRARRIGLVDDTCHPAALRQAAERWAAGSGGGEGTAGKAPVSRRAVDALARSPLGNALVYEKARKGVLEKTHSHYPAPLVAISIVQEGLKLPLPRALDLEAGAFSQLVVSDTAKNLMSIFFTKNEVEARAARIAADAREVLEIGVLGAGFMGSGLAQVLANKGYPVVMKDRDLEAVARGMKFAGERFDELVKRRRTTPAEAKTAMTRLRPTTGYEAFRRVDFVIEAVFEDLAIKRRVLAETEAAGPADLIFASNTSTIPIAEIAAESRRPENVVGMHFFSPVHKMPLLEVIRHPGTAQETLATTVEVGRKMGKTVIVVNDGPGFFTSRVLGPFINEAAHILVEGARIDEIDRALTRWGFPVGPLALVDEVGLDVGAHVSEVMVSHLGERFAPPAVFARLVEDGRTGRKGGRGFYVYGEGEKRPDEAVYSLIGWRPAPIADREIVERCVFQMLNETARCMEDGIITNPADVDIGVIFGFGFPPFRGGLLREADRLGLGYVVERLEEWAARHGSRFTPARLLVDMAQRGETFHGRGR